MKPLMISIFLLLPHCPPVALPARAQEDSTIVSAWELIPVEDERQCAFRELRTPAGALKIRKRYEKGYIVCEKFEVVPLGFLPGMAGQHPNFRERYVRREAVATRS